MDPFLSFSVPFEHLKPGEGIWSSFSRHVGTFRKKKLGLQLSRRLFVTKTVSLAMPINTTTNTDKTHTTREHEKRKHRDHLLQQDCTADSKEMVDGVEGAISSRYTQTSVGYGRGTQEVADEFAPK